MINNIEGQSKSELIKIVTEQQSHDTQREYYIMSLKAETDELRTQLAKANDEIDNLKAAFAERKALCQQAFDANEKQSNELAKANERVAALSLIIDKVCSAVQTDDEGNEPFIEVGNSLAALIFDDRERSNVLNKFAIENQIKGVTRVLACRELNLSEGDVDTIILMKEQLAKANERVERYKSAIDEECILWDFTVDEKNPRKSIQLLLDITDAVARDTDVNSKARKFAIEKKIEALEELSLNPNNESEDRIVALIDERIEQLRKEQEQC